LKKNLLLLIELQECDSQLVSLSTKKIKLPEKIAKQDDEFHLFKNGIEQNRSIRRVRSLVPLIAIICIF